MKRTLLPVFLIIAVVFPLVGCSSFSRSGRELRTYQRYVSKARSAQKERRAKLRANQSKIPSPQGPSEPIENIETGPQAMPSDGSQ